MFLRNTPESKFKGIFLGHVFFCIVRLKVGVLLRFPSLTEAAVVWLCPWVYGVWALPGSKHWTKCFMCMISFHSYGNSVVWQLLVSILILHYKECDMVTWGDDKTGLAVGSTSDSLSINTGYDKGGGILQMLMGSLSRWFWANKEMILSGPGLIRWAHKRGSRPSIKLEIVFYWPWRYMLPCCERAYEHMWASTRALDQEGNTACWSPWFQPWETDTKDPSKWCPDSWPMEVMK